MEKKISKKWVIIAVAAVVAVAIGVLVICSMVKAEEEKRRLATLEEIKWTVNELFVYSSPSEEDIQRIKENVKTFTQTPWMEEEFKKQGVAAIQKTDFGSNYVPRMDCFWVKEDQLLLEEVGYNCPEFKSAYTEMLNKQFDKKAGHFGFAEVAKAVIEGPGDEEDEIYNRALSYYSDPKSVFLNEYMPAYFAAAEEAALSTKDTAALLELCKASGAVQAYTDVSALVDMDAVLNYLTTGAEEITVKEGEGYYAGKIGGSDTDYEKEDWAPGELVSSKYQSVKYYGDLASIFYSSDGFYRDVEGNITSEEGNHHNEVHLKGERISWSGIEKAFIKYAYEDGMVSYHKDGYCFAISDGAIVCFVGDGFLFEFA